MAYYTIKTPYVKNLKATTVLVKKSVNQNANSKVKHLEKW